MKKIFILIITITGINFTSVAQWQQTGLLDTFAVKTIAVYGDTIFAGTDGAGIFSTSDEGNTWVVKNSGLSNLSINAITYDTNGTLYAGSKSLLLYTSVDTGNTWVSHNVGGTGSSISSIAVLGNNIFAGEAGDGVFLSTNSGSSWLEVGLCCASVLSLCTDTDGYVNAGTNATTVYNSVHPFTSWTQMNISFPEIPVRTLLNCGNLLFAGTYGGGIYVSSGHGSSWILSNNGLTDLNVISLVKSGQKMFAGTESGGVFLSVNQGMSWLQINEGLSVLNVASLAISGNYLYAGLNNGEVWKRSLSELTAIADVSSEDNNIAFYPNPAKDELSIDIPDYKNVVVKIYSINGQFINLLYPHATITTLAIENFKSGIYFIKVQNSDGFRTLKFIKN